MLKTLSLFALLTPICLLIYKTLQVYPGNPLIYLLFSATFNFLFLIGYSRRKIFFDTFIGSLLWLGFWLKFSIRVSFLNARFVDPVGHFDYSGEAYDLALTIATCGAIGLLVATLIRRRFLNFYDSDTHPNKLSHLSGWYLSHRHVLLSLFIFTIVFFTSTNAVWGFYQRGRSPFLSHTFIVTGTYTWLLSFGLASISGFILDIESSQKTSPWLASSISLLECFLSNVSMLSRGFILNSSALIWGYYSKLSQNQIRQSFLFITFIITVTLTMFAGSIFTVNFARSYLYDTQKNSIATPLKNSHESIYSAIKNPHSNLDAHLADVKTNTLMLFIDRWVGIEGVMSVSSYPHLGWPLFRQAVSERFSNKGTSFYDLNIAINSPYKYMNQSENHFISLPGFIAFLYYPGSLFFLFLATFFIGIFSALFESFVYRFTGDNLFLSSLFMQVVAYRFIHFGYAPEQSYLLFFTIIANVLLFFSINRMIAYYSKRRLSQDSVSQSP